MLWGKKSVFVSIVLLTHLISVQTRGASEDLPLPNLDAYSEEGETLSSEVDHSTPATSAPYTPYPPYEDESSEISMLSEGSESPSSPESQFQRQMQELGFEEAWVGLKVDTKARIWRVFRSCLQERKKTFYVQFSGSNGLTQRGPTSFLSTFAKRTKDRLRAVYGTSSASSRNAPATDILDALLIHKLRASNLDAKQAVCLAVCAASNAFDYKLNMKSVLVSASSSVEKTWNAPTGICWDYTRLAAHTLKVISQELQGRQEHFHTYSSGNMLYYRTSSNFPHSFLEVRFNEEGSWLGVDPMPEFTEDPKRSGICTFVDPSLPKGPRAKKKW